LRNKKVLLIAAAIAYSFLKILNHSCSVTQGWQKPNTTHAKNFLIISLLQKK